MNLSIMEPPEKLLWSKSDIAEFDCEFERTSLFFALLRLHNDELIRLPTRQPATLEMPRIYGGRPLTEHLQDVKG